jgi:hypothetical protein
MKNRHPDLLPAFAASAGGIPVALDSTKTQTLPSQKIAQKEVPPFASFADLGLHKKRTERDALAESTSEQLSVGERGIRKRPGGISIAPTTNGDPRDSCQ